MINSMTNSMIKLINFPFFNQRPNHKFSIYFVLLSDLKIEFTPVRNNFWNVYPAGDFSKISTNKV